MERVSLINRIKSAGIVGCGGAGFPTHVKVNTKAEIVIGNGAECEPLLRVDQQMMAKYSERIVKGLEYVMSITGAKKGYIALKGKYKEAIKNLQIAIRNSSFTIEIFILGDYYPAGDEQDIVYEVTGRIVPEGGIPIMVGCVVDNVTTLYMIADAVIYNRNFISRPVTIGGAVKEPKTVWVRIGTSFKELIEYAGGVTEPDYVVIDGGPMMGNIVDENSVVKKTTSGILVLPRELRFIQKKLRSDRVEIRNGKSTCDQCFECTITCYRNLLGHSLYPHKIMRTLFLEPESYSEESLLTMSFLCSQCGLCDLYSCPMDLSPRKVFRFIRQKLMEKGIKNPHKRSDLKVHPEREWRRVSVERLIERLGIKNYDVPAPFVEEEYIPKKVRISLNQHIGAPSIPEVKKGDVVKEGDLIASVPEEELGANIHASVSGKITEVNEEYIEIMSS